MASARRIIAAKKVEERAEVRLVDHSISMERQHAAARSINLVDRFFQRVIAQEITAYR